MRHACFNSPNRSRRVSRAPLPASPMRLRHVARLWILGLLLAGCGDRDESPLGPPDATTAAPTTAMGDVVARADKLRHAVDLGAPTTSTAAPAALSADLESAGATSIPFAPKPGPFAHAVPDCDDCMFDGFPIGFTFAFFGNNYTTFSLSTNGFITFTPGQTAGCCSGQPVPWIDFPNNIIAAAWTDLYSPGGGGIFYETRGQAPNRFLVVAFQNLPWFPEVGINRVTTQIVLYEGSNTIEIHTANQSAGHIYTQGVEDGNGFRAASLPGRSDANYGLTNDAVRFTTFGNFWSSRSAVPTARQRPAVAAAGGSLYAVGGLNGAGTALTSVVAYSSGSNSWSSRAALPAARYGSGAAGISGKLYVAGGFNSAGTLTRSLYVYTPSTNRWVARAGMPAASGCGGSGMINGMLYVFTGCTLLSTGSQVGAGLLHRYDPSTDTWTTLTAAPAAHVYPAVGVLDGKLYVAGGSNNSGQTTGRLDVYDPATNTWTTRSPMPTARLSAAGAGVGGLFYVVGGRSGTAYLNTVQAYNPATESWGSMKPVTTARAGLGLALVNSEGRFYAVGGRNASNVLGTNERYTP